jgi:hypothetical protein
MGLRDRRFRRGLGVSVNGERRGWVVFVMHPTGSVGGVTSDSPVVMSWIFCLACSCSTSPCVLGRAPSSVLLIWASHPPLRVATALLQDMCQSGGAGRGTFHLFPPERRCREGLGREGSTNKAARAVFFSGWCIAVARVRAQHHNTITWTHISKSDIAIILSRLIGFPTRHHAGPYHLQRLSRRSGIPA